jgi:hypothetical protein
MEDLVQRLSQGSHPVEVSLRPDRTCQAFKDAIDRGCVHLRFTQTRGGTELSVPVDRQRSDFDTGDFASGTGQVRVSGELTLDFVRVRCLADISLSSLDGNAHLEILGPYEFAL